MKLMELDDSEIGEAMEVRLSHSRDPGGAWWPGYEEWRATGTLILSEEIELDVVTIDMLRTPLSDPELALDLDGMDADLGNIGAVVLDEETGEPSVAVDELVGIGGHMLIVRRVTCDPRLEGRHIGRWVVAEAIQAMKPGIEFVAVIAAPLDHSKGAGWEEICQKLREVWASIGFIYMEEHVMVLNPDLSEPVERMKDLRERFGVRRD